MTETKEEEWVNKCLSCTHCYRKRNDADYLYCRCKNGCNYKPKKIEVAK